MGSFSKKNSSDWVLSGKTDSLGRPIYEKKVTAAPGSNITGSLDSAIDDFRSADDSYPEEEYIGQIDRIHHLGNYLMDRGIALDDFTEMDTEAQDEILRPYAANSGTHRRLDAEEIDAMFAELDSYGFDRYFLAEEETDKVEIDAAAFRSYRANAYDGAMFPVQSYSTNPKDILHHAYVQQMLTPKSEGGFRGSFEQYVQSSEGREKKLDYDTEIRQFVQELAYEWGERTEGQGKMVVINSPQGTTTIPQEQFYKNPLLETNPGDGDYSQTWIQDKDGKTITILEDSDTNKQNVITITRG